MRRFDILNLKPMLFKKIFFLLTLLTIIFFSNCQKRKKDINEEKKIITNVDSLRQATLMKYLSIPKNLDTLVYYSDFDEIIENLKILEDYSYDDFSKELIKIAKFKCYIMFGNFDDSKKELNQISNETDYKDFKNFYFGVYYYMKKDSIKSNQYFETTYNSMKSNNINSVNCYQFALLAKLTNNKIDTISCPSSIKESISRLLIGKTKKEVISKEVMGSIEF